MFARRRTCSISGFTAADFRTWVWDIFPPLTISDNSSQTSISFRKNATALAIKVSTNRSSFLTSFGTSDRSIFKATKRRLPLQITFQPIFASMTHSFNEAAKSQGASAGGEHDEIERMLIETNPWFLGLTALVSMMHVMWVIVWINFNHAVVNWSCQFRNVGVQIRCIPSAPKERDGWGFCSVGLNISYYMDLG